jgi:hypothetical protein
MAADPIVAVKTSYERGVTDEFVEPVRCCRWFWIANGKQFRMETL